MKKSLWGLMLFLPLISLAQSNPAQQEFYQELTRRFARIDTLSMAGADYIIKDPDIQQKENDALIAFLERNSELLFVLPDTLDYNLLYISKSADRNLCLVSWDTRLGGTMIDFATLAFYRTPKGIISKLLLEETGDNTKFHYDIIYTVVMKDGQKAFLAHGFGQGASTLPWQDVRSFIINGEDLEMPPLFPGNQNRMFLEFDRQEFKEGEQTPVVKWEKGGKRIIVPIGNGSGGFSGNYKPIDFNGRVYK